MSKTIAVHVRFETLYISLPFSAKQQREMTKAKFRRRTSHEPNRMQMRENKEFCSFAFDSAHVKYGV